MNVLYRQCLHLTYLIVRRNLSYFHRKSSSENALQCLMNNHETAELYPMRRCGLIIIHDTMWHFLKTCTSNAQALQRVDAVLKHVSCVLSAWLPLHILSINDRCLCATIIYYIRVSRFMERWTRAHLTQTASIHPSIHNLSVLTNYN